VKKAQMMKWELAEWREVDAAHWGGLFYHECTVADFNEMAVDHGDDPGSSHERGKLSPAHCAAAAAEPKAYPGGHGADQPDDMLEGRRW
jgi:hypothetical protein